MPGKIHGRIVELSAVLRPTARLQSLRMQQQPVLDYEEAREHADGSKVDMRIKAHTQPGLPPDTHLWAVVETYPSGFEQTLIGGHCPTAIEATAKALAEYQRIRAARKA